MGSRNQENFVRRLINTESQLASEIPPVERMNDTREKYYSVKQNTKKFHDQGEKKSQFKHAFIERDNHISKQNALLIRNLLEISHGKRVSILLTLNMLTPYNRHQCLKQPRQQAPQYAANQ